MADSENRNQNGSADQEEREKERFTRGFVSGILVMLLCVSIVYFVRSTIEAKGSAVRGTEASATVEETQAAEGSDTLVLDDSRILDKIHEIQGIVDETFINEIDSSQVESYIYKGLVAGLADPYAAFYTVDELKKVTESTSGEYFGVGATLSQNRTTGVITVVKCFEGTPSAEAGMLPGDILYSVDDTPVTGVDLTEVVSMIKKGKDDVSHIQVMRDGETEPITFDVARVDIEVPTVTHEMLENKIGYIAISSFDTITESQFTEALTDLESQGMEKLVIDLRNNLGGVLQTCTAMLDQLLPEGLIVYTEDKAGTREEYRSDAEHQFNKPMAVLVNGSSASASEIFAGAIKDYGTGTIVGTQTYGKGIVQRIFELEDGTALKLTIAHYYTPKGNDIHEVGVTPDVEIDLNEELKKKNTITHEEDNQLQKAIEILNEK